MYGLSSTMSVSKKIFAEPCWDIFLNGWGNVDLRRFRLIMESLLLNGKLENSIYEASIDYSSSLPGHSGFCHSVYRICTLLNVTVNDNLEAPNITQIEKDIVSLTFLGETTIYAFYDPKTLKLTSHPTPATGTGTVKDRHGNVIQFVNTLTLPADYEVPWSDFDPSLSKISMGGDLPEAFLEAWPFDKTGEPMEFHGSISGVEEEELYVFFPNRTVLSSDSGRKHYGLVLEYSEIDSGGMFPSIRSTKMRYAPKEVESSYSISSEMSCKALPTSQMTFDQSVYADFKETDGNKRIVAKLEPFSEDMETIYGEGMAAWVIKDYGFGDGNRPTYEAFYVEL